MKKIISLALGAAVLTACNSGTTETAETTETMQATDVVGVSVCPPESVISGVDVYANSLAGMPDAALDTAAWHEANGARDGVVTTSSGLQYTVVQEPISGPSPEGSQTIKVNYHGIFRDGTVFDSSYERGEPIEFPANGVIKGWIEAMGTMKPCEARTLYIPSDLAYGDADRGPIPGGSTLLFHVQLLEVKI